MEVAFTILLALASASIIALLLVGIIGVIVSGQWREIDDWMNDEEDK